MKLHELIQELETITLGDKPSAFRFDTLVSQISEIGDPDAIEALASILDDQTEYWEVMFSVVQAMEYFPTEIYVAHLLSVTPALWKRAPEWTETLYVRLFNSSSHRTELEHQLQNASSIQKTSVASIIEQINRHNAEFLNKTKASIQIIHG